MTREPFRDDFRDGDARDVATDAKQSEPHRRNEHLRLQMFGNQAEKRERHFDVGRRNDMRKRQPIHRRAAEHHSRGENAREADAALVENDTAEKQHQQENVENAVRPGIKAVFRRRPRHSALVERGFQRGGKGRHNVPKHVAGHHRERHDDHHNPTSKGRISCIHNLQIYAIILNRQKKNDENDEKRILSPEKIKKSKFFCVIKEKIVNLRLNFNKFIIKKKIMFGIGVPELLVIAFIILLVFGGRKIPELMKGLGKGVKSFKDGMKEVEDDLKLDEKKEAKKDEP